MVQGEACSSCQANLIPGVQAQTVQHKGDKGDPGIGQKGEQVRWGKATRSTVNCMEILSTFFLLLRGSQGQWDFPVTVGEK